MRQEGEEEEKAIGRCLHNPPIPTEFRGHANPCATRRHTSGAVGLTGVWVKCGKTNNFENLVFLLKLPRAYVPS